MAPNQFYFARRVLYQLQKQYGAKVDYYHIVSTTIDDTTGRTNVVRTKYIVNKAIRLPDSQIRKVLLGGQYDKDEVIFIFDKTGLPSDFTPHQEDYLIHKNKRYNVKSIEVLDNDQGYQIVADSVTSDSLDLDKEQSTTDNVGITQEVTNE